MEQKEHITSYKLVSADAVPPTKNNQSDAGFDLCLTRLIKTNENKTILYYGTGISIEPPPDFWYMLVVRSSTVKLGYCMANGVGIIDTDYRGEIIVALHKTDALAPDLELPCKAVQIIAMPNIKMQMQQSESLAETLRSDQGGLGSRQFK